MSDYIFRRNAVYETLRGSRRQVHQLWVQAGLGGKGIRPILTLAKQNNIPIRETNKQKLGNLARDKGHQGVVLEVGDYQYAELDDILTLAEQRNEQPFILLLDLVQGPHNVGMLLRSAEASGVHGVIIQHRRAPDITPAIVTASAGATEHLLIAQVTNLNTTIRHLKDADIWVIGTAMDHTAQPLETVDLNLPLALIIGHEGSGLRHQVRQNCDLLIKLPMRGKITSLNAAASGSIILYAALQARS